MGEREVFVAFSHFPFFADASIGRLVDVTMPHPGHLCWTQLDIDLAVESIDHREHYPLICAPARRVADGPAPASKGAARRVSPRER